MTAPLRTFSYGGGVQSTAALVLQAQGRLDFPVFLFCNVGDDSEDPETIAYVEHVAKPYAAHHGIELKELQRDRRDGTVETLYGRLTREGSRSVPIPVRMDNGKPGTRSCTADFKIKIVGRELKRRGATEANKAVVGIGISLDEIERVNNRRAQPYEIPSYPLIFDLDPALRRSDCERLIRQEPLPESMAGPLRAAIGQLPVITRGDLLASGFTRLPRPPKSACWFCPFHRPNTWAEMRRDRPELFRRSCELETLLTERRTMLGKDPVYFTRFARPLADAIPEAQDMLPLFDVTEASDAGGLCDNGACFT